MESVISGENLVNAKMSMSEASRSLSSIGNNDWRLNKSALTFRSCSRAKPVARSFDSAVVVALSITNVVFEKTVKNMI